MSADRARLPSPARQNPGPYKATPAVRSDQPDPVINRNIYGHFAEHLGRLIYGGLWVGEGSSIPNTRGLRNNVMAALKELRVPVLRWPGGCFATFVKDHSGNRIQKLAVGSHDDNYDWTEALMSRAAKHMDGLSLHYYTLPTSGWERKGSATQFGDKEWHATLARTLRIEEFIQKHSAVMDKYDPQKRVGLMVDEWGAWHDPEPGRDMGALYQQNTVRDAVVAGINLNVFNRRADRVRMANIAQVVNVLQAMILTDGERMVLTPTYHVFRMYRVHQGATLIPTELTAPEYRSGQAAAPSMSVSASRDAEGRLHLSLVNLDPNRPAEVTATFAGAAERRRLTRA